MIASSRLTSVVSGGQNCRKSGMCWASRPLIGMAGVGSPYESGQGPHKLLFAAFSRLGAQVMGDRGGRGCMARRCSIGLPTPVSVARPFGRGLAVQHRNWSVNHG